MTREESTKLHQKMLDDHDDDWLEALAKIPVPGKAKSKPEKKEVDGANREKSGE